MYAERFFIMRLLMFEQTVQKDLAIFLEFLLADAFDVKHFVKVLWLHRAHIPQRGIGKDEIRRYLVA